MAAYGNRFVFEFVSQNGDDVEILISKKNYNGTPAYRPVGKPPILRRERNGCILGTSLEIYAECKIDKEYAELYTSSADEFLVELYKNRVLQWRGYVSPELYAEPDIAPPYDVQIIATDGLGELKNTVFDRPAEAYSLKNHLDYILEKTGLSLELDLISSLSWDDEVADNDPMILLDIKVDLTHLASESDYEVLQDILTSFNAHITQQDGKWMILRKTDLYDNLSRFRQAEFGSVNKTTWWPIGILSADIMPAKRKLTLTHENNYKDNILPSLIAGVSGGWELSPGVYYNTEEKAYILPNEAGIAYTIELPVYPLAVPLKFSINARPLFEKELREDRAVLMYYFELKGTVDGVEGTYYLQYGYTTNGFTLDGPPRWHWSPEQLPGQPLYNMETWWRSDYPEEVEPEVTTINGILPLGDNVVPQSIRLVVQNFPLLSSYRIAIYDIILTQADQIRGLRLIAEVGNAARESTEVSVVMSTSADPMLAMTLYGVLHSDGGINQWHTPYNTATDLLRFLALDYAMLYALPSVRYKGTLNFPSLITPWIPIIFTRDDTYYFVETYEYDLLNDELGVELISIPNAKVTLESETITEIPEGSSGNSTSSSSGGGTGGANGGTIIIDASMSDESENAVQNKVIKAYVDGKAAEAQAAAEQYIQNEVLTYYATTKYVEGLVNDLEKEIDGRGYLTSAAMGNYATKDDIKGFVTKGTTLEHYGITDAMAVRNEQSNVDLNDLTTPGAYTIMGGTNSHNPHNYGTLLTIHGKSGYFIGQIAIKFNGETFVRSKNDQPGADGDYWTEWRTIVDSSNIGSYALTQTNADSRYLKLTGGEINGSLIAKGVTGQDIDLRVTGDSYSLALRIGSGGTNRGLFDVTQNSWWIHRREDGYAIFNGESYYTGNLTAGGGLTLGGSKITSWSAIASYLALPYLNKNAALMPLNAFDNAGSLSISHLSNALYAASDRMEVELQGFSKTDPAGLFSGNYEQAYDVAAGTTGVLTISKSARLFADYPYGDTFVSFYYTYTPESVSVEVYDTSKGWQTLTLKERRGNNNGVYVFSNTSHYYVTQMRITVVAQAGQIARLVQIDHILSRGRLKELPVVTKFAIDQELYGRLICKGGITLGSKTITSWDEIKASGDYLPLTGGTLTGALTINSSLSVSSSIFCYGNIKISAGGALQLGNEDALKDWDSLRIKVVERTETSGVSIAPNVLNKWTTPLTGTLTINFSSGRDGVANYYMMEFTTGATVPTITLPSVITWQGGDNLLARLEPNKTYQISILNNLAVGGAF